MEKEQFLRLMQRYVANIAISGSTLRNQGAKGVAKKAREFLANLNLETLKKINPLQYPEQLEKWTDELKEKLPKDAKKWGTARKALNVFLVQTYLNRYLSAEYGLDGFEDVLETPLDKQATSELQKLADRQKLPRWDGIKKLTPDNSKRYQEFAAGYARQQGIPRARLDIMLWRVEE